jgi:hypothetical protein
LSAGPAPALETSAERRPAENTPGVWTRGRPRNCDGGLGLFGVTIFVFWRFGPRATAPGVRSLSPVEAALLIAIGGSVLAVGIPAFVQNLHASRLVEPMDGLTRIAAAAASVAAAPRGAARYPASVGPTPRSVPAGKSAADPPGAWDHPSWLELGFRFTRAHRYAFEFESTARPGLSQYTASARGDLDGDGQLSEFSIRGEARGAEPPRTFPLEMRHEIE